MLCVRLRLAVLVTYLAVLYQNVKLLFLILVTQVV